MALDPTVRFDDARVTLERTLMDDYVRGAGHDPQAIRARGDDAARMLLLSAAAYAASRLRRDTRSAIR